jgi:hypothetical protein
MSIKTIDKPIQGAAGVAKRINKGAEKMVFDILQSTQYSMPIQSTVRELVTNACDSQREKEIAIEILTGKKKIKDYYIERHGPQYEDSNFDLSYYYIVSLDHAHDEIDLVYTMNEGVGYCDTFSVTDYGVGIGDRRLEGILELGYSTKRNTPENFGAFGLGAKSALSTGIDFYTIETVHNGRRFKCNCYNYKTDFIIPEFNVGLGKKNPFITFTDGTKIYYEEINVNNIKNYTTVSFGVKRHNRNKFEESVEERLLYFDNVNFTIVDNEEEDQPDRKVKFKAEILHNSKNLIVSDTYVFNRPHIVLVKDENATTGINYGFIDFRELEMEQMYGSVAFKCPTRQVITNEDGTETVIQDGVDVTPSREKVIWNESTKKYIKGVIIAAAQEASDMVQEELQETDFLKWVDTCRSVITGNSSDNRILNKLSRIINKDDIKPKYGPNPKIKYGPANKMFEGLRIMKPTELRKNGKEVIEREVVKDWQGFDAKHFYERTGSWSKYKDMYLMKDESDDFYTKNHVTTYTLEDLDAKFDERIRGTQKGDAQQKLIKEKARVQVKRGVILKLIESSEWFKSYDEVEVPEEWIEKCKEVEAEDEEKSQFSNLSPVERREIEKRMVAYTVRYDDRKSDKFTMDKIEPKAKDLMNSANRIYYCTREDEGKMKQAAMLLKLVMPTHEQVYPNSNRDRWDKCYREPVYWYEHPPVRFMKYSGDKYEDWAVPVQGWDTPQLIRVSESKVKFITQNPNVKHIDELFLQLTTKNGYTMDESLVKYYTAHKLKKINQFKFMQGLSCIHDELQKDYCELQDLRNDNYSEWEYRQVRTIAPSIIEHMDKLYEFQKFCNECDDAEQIQDKSRELFVLSDVSEARAADLDILAKYDNMVEFAEDIKPLLDEVECLEERDCTMSPELEKEVRVYLRAKNRETWDN